MPIFTSKSRDEQYCCVGLVGRARSWHRDRWILRCENDRKIVPCTLKAPELQCRTTEVALLGCSLTFVNGDLIQHRVRTREVDVLEEARAELSAVGELALVRVDVAIHVHEHALSWSNVA